MSSPAKEPAQRGTASVIFWDLLTFDRLLTGPVIHLIYWSGLGFIILIGFGVIGTAVGLSLRGDSVIEKLIALPALVAGLLVVGALALMWRAFCEFYVAIFRIADDLRSLRESGDLGPRR